MKRWKFGITFLATILTCLGLTSALAVERGKLPMATDLSREAKIARDKQIPILILFSAPGCSYCARVRNEVLIPTTRNADYDNKVILLEVESGNSGNIVDFDGKTIALEKFFAKHKVGFTPTVKFFDAAGNEVAAPIIGLVTVDYYGGFLDQGIDNAISKIRTQFANKPHLVDAAFRAPAMPSSAN